MKKKQEPEVVLDQCALINLGAVHGRILKFLLLGVLLFPRLRTRRGLTLLFQQLKVLDDHLSNAYGNVHPTRWK